MMRLQSVPGAPDAVDPIETDPYVAEAVRAHAQGNQVFLTRMPADRVVAVERAGWRLDHIADGPHETVFCVFVRRD